MPEESRQIVDWHTHVWLPEHLGPHWGGRLDSWQPDDPPSRAGSYGQHQQAMHDAGVTQAIVISVVSDHLELRIPNEYIAAYVGAHDNLVGVGSVDPNSPTRVQEVRHLAELGLQGIKLSPPYQAFHPHSDAAMEVYREASELDLFLIFHQGTVFTPTGPLDDARPVMLDKVAREFPDLKIIIAHVGQPWMNETIALMGKHANVYADVSSRLNRPWQMLNILAHAADYGAQRKLLWGSDFPFFGMKESLDQLGEIAERYGSGEFFDPAICAELATQRPLSLLGLEPGLRIR